jgi:hypothetical protein
MLRSIIRMSWLVAVLLGATFALAQAEFSASVVDTQKGDTPQAKMYFAKDKIRIEPTQKNPRGGGAVIVNLAAQTLTVLMDQQHMYMEMPAQTQRQKITYNFFRTGDVENACSDWVNQGLNKGGTCRKIGDETVNGRSAVKYEGTSASGETSTFWLDSKLKFPLKWQGKNNSGEIRDIQEGAQPSNLFDVPAGYTKFDMGGMMQHPQ